MTLKFNRKWPVKDDFKAKVLEICGRLKIEPDVLMGCMAFESGGTFSPSIRNAAGSGATGLIQFMPSTAKGLGTTTEALAKMTAVQQLDYVEKYFKNKAGKIKTITDCYMAILWPVAVGKGDDYVLFRKGTIAYKQNAGLDINKNGFITAGEAARLVKKKLESYPLL